MIGIEKKQYVEIEKQNMPLNKNMLPSYNYSPFPAKKVLVLDPLHHTALEELDKFYDLTVKIRPSEVEMAHLLKDAEVVVMRSGVQMTGAMIRSAKALKVIARAGVGVDNIDLAAARATGVTVFNIPGESASAVAEFAFGLLLSVARRICEADRQIRRNIWNKSGLLGMELGGKRLGLIGVGEIGGRIGMLARAFGMEVGGCVANPTTERRHAFAQQGVELMKLGDLMGWADMVSIQIPLTGETKNLIGERELALLAPGAILVNVSRGGVVDESALMDALVGGRLGGIALDVHANEFRESPFSTFENALLTPHIGAMTEEGQRRIAIRLLEGIDAALRGDVVPNRVN